MSGRLRALVLIVLAVILVWIWRESPRWRRHTPEQLTDLQVAEAWLHCIDCRGTFIERLRAIPPSRRDTVVRFLAAALLSGPDSARAIRLNQDLVRTWQADSLYRTRHGVPPDMQVVEFFDRYRRGFDVMWRSRAATALGVVCTSVALAALEDALHLPLTSFGDSTIRRFVLRAQADTGRGVVDHCRPVVK